MKNSEYINANWIKKEIFNIDQDYIAAQGPIEESTEYFWKMIIQHKVPVILMLTKLFEKNREKCFQYWPSLNEKYVFKSLITLECISEKKIENYPLIHRQVKVKAHKEIIIDLIQFEGWPDHSVAKTEDFEFLQSYIALLMDQKSGPLTVHCSAGIGRTGLKIIFIFLN